MFYDRFKQLCDMKGVSCNKAALEIGLSNATPTKWRKTGATPVGDTLQRIANYFGVTMDYLLGNDEDSRALEKAKTELTEYVKSNPSTLSGKRLDVLFNASGYDHVIVCFNLGIEQSYLDNWLNNNDLPPKPIVDKILGVFLLKPEDLLSNSELAAYNREAQEWYETEKTPATSGECSNNIDNTNEVNIAYHGNPSSNLLTTDEADLLRKYRSLNDQGKEYIRQTLDMAAQIYIKSDRIPDLEKHIG